MIDAIWFLEDDLYSKERQIDDVLNLISVLDRNDVFLSEENNLLYPNNELINTLKSTIYLMLYNAIESTFSECLQAIHDTLEENNENFNELRNPLKREILSRIKKGHRNIDDIASPEAVPLEHTIHSKTFTKNLVFSGNIDREEIKNIAEIYGFSTNSIYNKTRHGETLKAIKSTRNRLAHGDIDFVGAAQQDTIPDLFDLKEKTMNYIYAMLGNVDDYLENRDFKE